MKKFADDAVNGLIVFTLGSIVKSSSMPQKAFQTFRRVFSSIPQRVVWKWEGEIPPDISSNIMMIKWLPQHDLLGNEFLAVPCNYGRYTIQFLLSKL